MLKAIVGSTALKAASSVASIIVVPILLKELGTADYGTWVTLTALIVWLNLFDFGSGYSLKNRISEAHARNDLQSTKELVAGTIQLYCIFAAIIGVAFIICQNTLKIFEENTVPSLILYIPLIITFPFITSHFILQGLGKFNMLNLLLTMQNVVWLVVVVVLSMLDVKFSSLKLAILYSLNNVLINSFLFFYSLRSIRFDIRSLFDFRNLMASKDSLRVGIRFFILQVSSLILYSLGNMMVYSNLSSNEVARYDVVNKVFLLAITVFNIIISVFWTEISKAKALNDANNLRVLFKRLLAITFAFNVAGLAFSFVMPLVIRLWTKGVINLEYPTLLPFLFLLLIQTFAYTGAVFLNAFEELKGQILFSIFASLCFFPVAKLLFAGGRGITSVPIASGLLTVPTVIFVLIAAGRKLSSYGKDVS